jgi:hypothetical protein
VRQLVAQRLDERNELGVDEQHAVARVLDDVGDLVREQARVDGVYDGADAGYPVVEFEMAIGVPSDRSDAIALANSPVEQCVRERSAARADVGVRVPMNGSVCTPGDDFHVGMPLGGVIDDRPDRQG